MILRLGRRGREFKFRRSHHNHYLITELLLTDESHAYNKIMLGVGYFLEFSFTNFLISSGVSSRLFVMYF